MTMPICFVDTETTGLHPDKQLWEVAIIRRDFDVHRVTIEGDELVEPVLERRYETFVPVDLSNADLFGLNVGRFYDRHPTGRSLAGESHGEAPMPLKAIVAHKIARMTHGCRFIGGAPSFDAEVLGRFLRAHELLPTWHHRLVDTHDVLTGYLIGKGQIDPAAAYSLSKDEKVQRIGVEPHNDPDLVHTAMGDAQHEADIWDAVMTS